MIPPPDPVAAGIRNEVKVSRILTATHREIHFRVGSRHGLHLGVSAYLRGIFPRYPEALIAKWCQEGLLKADGAPCLPEQPVRPGMLVELLAPLPVADPSYTPPPLRLLHHDAHLAVADKAPGHLAHPAGKIMSGTLLQQLQDWAEGQGVARDDVRLVNRIDRDTSGILLASLRLDAHVALARALAERQANKEYLAICLGVPAGEAGEWTEPIGVPDGTREQLRCVRADGQPSRTAWRVVESDGQGRFSLLRLVLHTGRQHQIRVHASHHGLPLVGDWVYGAKCAELPGQALHACLLELPHPAGGTLRVECPLHPDLQALWNRLRAGGAPTPAELSPEQRNKLGLDGGD